MKGIKSYLNIQEGLDIVLNANESYFGTDEKTKLEFKDSLLDLELNRYPEDTSKELKNLYAKYANVCQNNVLVGNGSDEMIGLVIGLNISSGKKLLTLDPDFSMFDYYVSMQGGETVKLKTERDGSYNVDEFISLGKEENVSMVIFSTPNNPTGYATPVEDIIKVLEAFKDITVLVDEAYFEFNGVSMIPFINEYNNLLVTRTLSKAWGLAACRVGFLIGNKELIGQIEKYKVPYNVNSLSQMVASVVLKNEDKVQENIKAIVCERERVYQELMYVSENSPLYIEFVPSKGNYIFGRTSHKEVIVEGLKSMGILIRSFSDNSFRITIGSPYENNKLIKGLREILDIGGRNYA